MQPLHSELERLVHTLVSPLTALRGATGLLNHYYRDTVDQQGRELLDSLETSTRRLQRACDLVLARATLLDDHIVIQLSKQELDRFWVEQQRMTHEQHPPSEEAPADNDAVIAQTPTEIAATSSRRDTILLAVQQDNTARAMMSIVIEAGYNLLLATTAEDVIDRARLYKPDLIILDGILVREDRHAFLVLNEDPDTKLLPVIIIGHRDDDGLVDAAPSRTALPRHLLDPLATAADVLDVVRATITAGQARQRTQPHVLVVDDEADIRELITLQFEREGYRVSAVGHGTAAFQIVQQHQFNLIILDLMLPDIDGFTVLGGLRAQPRTQITPIILLSAISSLREKVHGLHLGADDYITKPFSNDELKARAQAAMRRSEREGEANPSTRLPGNVAIERALTQRIAQQQPFAVCYSDIDNFKAYNDTYGFFKGDAVIQQTAHILIDAVHEFGNPDDFVGHISGDDFIIITTPEKVDLICRAALVCFDKTMPLFYDPAARERGYIEAIDRQGRRMRFPLLSLSIAVVSSERHSFSHPGEVAQRSVKTKKLAKETLGSVYVVDADPVDTEDKHSYNE